MMSFMLIGGCDYSFNTFHQHHHKGERLGHNQKLHHHEFLQSSSGHKLIHQVDGNVVLYNAQQQAIWASNTCGQSTHELEMQFDGNLVLYGHGRRPLWASNTCGSGGNYFVMQSDGNAVIYDGSRPVWATNTCQGGGGGNNHHHRKGDRLGRNQKLHHHEFLQASSGHKFVHQADGNVVLYNAQQQPIWASNTCGQRTHELEMQGDGNLVLYGHGRKPLWASNTCGSGGNSLVMQSDGNAVIYNCNCPVWTTDTDGQ